MEIAVFTEVTALFLADLLHGGRSGVLVNPPSEEAVEVFSRAPARLIKGTPQWAAMLFAAGLVWEEDRPEGRFLCARGEAKKEGER